jgi:hypothetical protein
MQTGSLSLDLDNQWSYMKTHGDTSWTGFPSYLDRVVPRVLEFLDERDASISFFIVGQDAALSKNRLALQSIADAGHEIANHSFQHDPWLHLYSEQQLDEELRRSEAAIEAATGVKPLGFRGPGFSLSADTLRVLARRGYLYDATVFPNLLNPLARAYFFAKSNLSKEEREQRSALFGSWRDALRPVKPFIWSCGDRELVEVPVTTMPIFKVPIHVSYVVYLAGFSRALAMAYVRVAIAMCALTGTAPSILLHPLDFLGVEDDVGLEFFPGMQLGLDYKLAVVAEALTLFGESFEMVTVRQQVERLSRDALPMRAVEGLVAA